MLSFELTKDTPYLALSGELWSVFYEYFNRNWSCYKGFLLYYQAVINMRAAEQLSPINFDEICTRNLVHVSVFKLIYSSMYSMSHSSMYSLWQPFKLSNVYIRYRCYLWLVNPYNGLSKGQHPFYSITHLSINYIHLSINYIHIWTYMFICIFPNKFLFLYTILILWIINWKWAHYTIV